MESKEQITVQFKKSKQIFSLNKIQSEMFAMRQPFLFRPRDYKQSLWDFLFWNCYKKDILCWYESLKAKCQNLIGNSINLVISSPSLTVSWPEACTCFVYGGHRTVYDYPMIIMNFTLHTGIFASWPWYCWLAFVIAKFKYGLFIYSSGIFDNTSHVYLWIWKMQYWHNLIQWGQVTLNINRAMSPLVQAMA